MAKTAEKVAFAESVITVHVKRTSEPSFYPDGTEGWDVESKLMVPGQTIPLSVLPPYLSDAIVAGKVPGLKSMTQAQANKRVEAYQAAIGGFDSFEPDQEQEEDSELAEEE